MRKLVLIFTVALTIGGCGGATYKNVRQSPEFKMENLKSGGVVVLGAVSTEKALKNRERNRYGTILSDSIKSKNISIRLYSPGEASEKIGPKQQQQILEEYRNTRHLTAKNLGVLRDAFPVQYAMLSSIGSNRVSKDHSTYTDKSNNTLYTLKTRRKIETEIAVFDLSSGSIAWVGRSFRTFTNSEYINENASSEKGLMRVVDSYLSSEKIKKLYPKPYTTVEALERLYSGFSKDLTEVASN